jgi:hypothetical protein
MSDILWIIILAHVWAIVGTVTALFFGAMAKES